ncbi:unnamed protein product [Cercospora beticola]|nr:unnamed protein product [Cercospora beticola]
MRPLTSVLHISTLLTTQLVSAQYDPSQTLRFGTPADGQSVLVVGNGRLGGNVFGDINEQLWLNEDTIWSGLYQRRVNPNAKEAWPRVRDDLVQNKFASAGNDALANMTPDPDLVRHYQPAGHLNIFTNGDGSQMQDYNRILDISTGMVNINYTYQGIDFTREVFASYPDQVIGVRWRASAPFSATIYYERDQNIHQKLATTDNNEYKFYLQGGSDPSPGQLDFNIEGRLVPVDGSVSIVNGNAFQLDNTRGFDIFTDIQTTYRYPDSNERAEKAASNVAAAVAKGYDSVRSAAISDYQNLYQRVSVDFGTTSSNLGQQTTDGRLQAYRNDPNSDPQLTALGFNMGRYLFIGSSRKGYKPLPPNLQGLWNTNYDPPFGSRFTVNINTQMLDWPAGPTNLADEMLEPFFGLLDVSRTGGREQASDMYGLTGFVMHHNADAWGDVAPNDNGTEYTHWPMGAAWLGTHLLEYYRFTGDSTFLEQTTLPWLVEAAEFFYAWLFDYEGYLTTATSLSPEHGFYIPNGAEGAGQETGIDIGTSMVRQLLAQFFSDIIEGYTAIGQSGDDQVTKAKDALAKIKPPEIGSYGQILEWRNEYNEAEPGHRHLSPLFGLFPGSAMTPLVNNTLAQASQVLLKHRLDAGSGSTGWSRSWFINCFAKMYQGNDAWTNAQRTIQSFFGVNMLDTLEGPYSPFQQDGNHGFVSGITEMLLQSHASVIHILPAQTSNARTGSVKGLIGRGGFKVDISWNSGGGLSQATVISQRGSELALRLNNGQNFQVNGQSYSGPIGTEAGQSYVITPA